MPEKPTFLALLKALQQKRIAVVLLLGFGSGLPIMLLFKSLKIWLRREGFDLSTIGYIGWVILPYSFNFLWAAPFDRFVPLTIGRRRSWLLITQASVIASLIAMGLTHPTVSLPLVAAAATLLCFASASQDIVVDAYRREILPDNQLGLGAAIGVYGYRIAMLVASGFGLWIVDPETWGVSFNQMFFIMAAIMAATGILTFIFCSEPQLDVIPPQNLKQAVIVPFVEFFKRPGAVVIVSFILLFKIGDSMAGAMSSPFYVDIGFTNAQIGTITSGLGFLSTMAGLFVGGVLLFHFGYYRPLLIFGVLQAISTFFFTTLIQTGPNPYVLSGVVFFEDFTSGMGTAALVAFMSTLTNRQFSATQYALFSSLASFGRTFFSGFSGRMIAGMGYHAFFILCVALALPGLLLIFKMRQIQQKTDDDQAGGPTTSLPLQ